MYDLRFMIYDLIKTFTIYDLRFSILKTLF